MGFKNESSPTFLIVLPISARLRLLNYAKKNSEVSGTRVPWTRKAGREVPRGDGK